MIFKAEGSTWQDIQQIKPGTLQIEEVAFVCQRFLSDFLLPFRLDGISNSKVSID